MKKVKVMLAGIAVLAVVGGTFAFKAKNAYSATLYTSSLSTGCTIKAPANSTIAAGTDVFYTLSSAPTATQPCQTKKVSLVAGF